MHELSIHIEDSGCGFDLVSKSASFSAPITVASKDLLVGTMMESYMVEKTGDEGTFDYLVKEGILETTTLNMNDYTFMTLGGR